MSEIVTLAQAEESAAIVQQRIRQHPRIGLVLGSGLSSLADEIQDAEIIPCQEIPHWPVSTVAGHSGRLIIGRLAGKHVLVQQGRAHYYEGYSMSQITFPVRVMRLLGINTLVITNAAGGINREYEQGDLMLIKDHLNIPGLAGHNPLRGPNDSSIGPRFPDMTVPYDTDLRRLAHRVAGEIGQTLKEGVYAYVAGPSFETPAELRFLHSVGADAVGMSTVPSVVVARHAGIKVLGISSITNKAILDPSPESTISHEEVLEVGNLIIPRLSALIHNILQRLDVAPG
jgi:purine-nucleoside phosphorylase